MSAKRAKLIIGRWLDVILLGVVSTVAFVYISPSVLRGLLRFVNGISEGWHPLFILIVYLLVPIAIAYLLRQVGGFRLRDFDICCAWANPPTWFAAVIGVCLYPVLSFYLQETPCLDWPLFLYNVCLAIGLFCVGLICGICARVWLRPRLRKTKERQSNAIHDFPTDPEQFIRWLEEERPIVRPEDDLFATAALCGRLVRNLTEAPAKNISLIGPYGSGKTSVLNIVQHLLSEKGIAVLPMSAWGYEEKQLTTHVLRRVIACISKRTDCISIAMVPSIFQSVFFSNSWGLLNCLKFLIAVNSPEAIVRKVDNTLKMAGLQLVIFLEDLDRNHDASVDHQLYSVFNLFAGLDNVAFVVTYGEGAMVEPLTKITEKTEIMPSIDHYALYNALGNFRDYCLNRYADVFPIGCDRKHIDERFGIRSVSSQDYHRLQELITARLRPRSSSRRPVECLVELLRSPRVLKRACSQTWATWQQLHGEVYFDDLFVLSAVKALSSPLFHLLASHIQDFKLLGAQNGKSRNEELYALVDAALQDTPQKGSFHGLLQFLFPGWAGRAREGENDRPLMPAAPPHPQGVASTDSRIDYFARVLAEELNNEEPADQNVMRRLLEVNQHEKLAQELVQDMLADDALARRAEYFGKLLDPTRVLSMTSAFFSFIHQHEFHPKSEDADLTGRLWRMAMDNPVSEAKYRDWFVSQLAAYHSYSLRFTNDIYYFWQYRTREEADSKNRSVKLRQLYIEQLRHFTAEPAEFARILRKDLPYIWVLRHVVYDYQDNQTIRKQAEDPFVLWKPWLAELLARAAETEQHAVAMASIPLIYDVRNVLQRMQHAWKATFDEATGHLLFGTSLAAIMKIIATLKDSEDAARPDLEGEAKTVVDFAISHSAQWLSNQE